MHINFDRCPLPPLKGKGQNTHKVYSTEWSAAIFRLQSFG